MKLEDSNNFKDKSFFIKIFEIVIVLILLPLLLIIGIIYYSFALILSITIWITWGLQGRNILFVYSNSLNWSKYLEEIIKHIQDKAIILNWSERKHWKISLAVLAFNYFGGRRNFNPLAIVFKPFRLNKVFQFYEAFKEYKHGKTEKLEIIKANFSKQFSEGYLVKENIEVVEFTHSQERSGFILFRFPEPHFDAAE